MRETTYKDLLENIEADKHIPYNIEPIFKVGDLVEIEELGLRLYVAMIDFYNDYPLGENNYKKTPLYRLSFYYGKEFENMMKYQGISGQRPYHGNNGLKLIKFAE